MVVRSGRGGEDSGGRREDEVCKSTGTLTLRFSFLLFAFLPGFSIAGEREKERCYLPLYTTGHMTVM